MDKESLITAAREAVTEKNYDEAFEILEEILQEGVDIQALELKGDIFQLKEEPKEAMKCYDRALVIDLHQKSIWKSKGVALLSVGRNDEAQRSFEKAVKIDPDYADGWLGRGRMGMKVHDWEMALESFEKVTELDPSDDAGWFNKANALITGFGRMDEAIDCYKKAIEINGDSDEYWFSLGVAQKSGGDIAGARDSFKEVITLNRLHIMAKRYYDECNEKLGDEGGEPDTSQEEGGGELPLPPPEEEGGEDEMDYDEEGESEEGDGIDYDEDEEEVEEEERDGIDYDDDEEGEKDDDEGIDYDDEEEEDEEDEVWRGEDEPPVGASDEEGFFTNWVDMKEESFVYDDPPAPPPEDDEEDKESEGDVEEEDDKSEEEDGGEEKDEEEEGDDEEWEDDDVQVGASDEEGFFTNWVDFEDESFTFEKIIGEEKEDKEDDEEEDLDDSDDSSGLPGRDRAGEEEVQVRFCGKCGTKNEGNEICEGCGAELS